MGRPRKDSNLSPELQDVADQFDDFDSKVKEMTLDRMNMAPKEEVEPQTKLSSRDLSNSKDIYLQPERTIGCRDKFNEDYRKDYEFKKEVVQFIAENKEIIGESIKIWTRPFAGMPAEYWTVPVNKPVYGPRYLAEQIKACSYHRLTMQENKITGQDGMGQYYGSMAVDTTVQRLDAAPVTSRRSVFMGASGF